MVLIPVAGSVAATLKPRLAADSALVCADVHLGNMKSYATPWSGSLNSRARISLAVLGAVSRQAAAASAALVVAGDLFDYPHPESLLLHHTRNAVSSAPMFMPMLGNHDMHSTERGDNALEALDPHSAITCTNVKQGIVCVPFKPHVVVRDYLRAELAKLRPTLGVVSGPKSLMIHAGIADADTPAFMLHKADDFIQVTDLFNIMDEFGLLTTFAGNWHTPRVWSLPYARSIVASSPRLRVVQLGALVPTGFDNEGLLYGVHAESIFGSITLRVANGPRFLTLRHGEPPILRVIDAHFQTQALRTAMLGGPTNTPARVDRADSWDRALAAAKSTFVLSSFVSDLFATVKAPPGADMAATRADAEQSLLAALSVKSPSNASILPGRLHHLAVVPDARAASVEHEVATRAALGNRAHFRESVEAYLDKMEVPEGVDRGVVLGRVLTYLGRTT